MPSVDLVVVGGGPAGLMAAKTAAENGLRVVLVERKTQVQEIRRACAMMIATLTGRYLGERVILTPAQRRLSFPRYGFSVPYSGQHQDLYSWSVCSHRGNRIKLGDYEENRSSGSARISATYDKEVLLGGLLAEARELGVEIRNSFNVVGTETRRGKVTIRTGEGESFVGTFVIAADGRSSRIAQSLGLNKARTFYGTATTRGFEMVDCEMPEPFALKQIFLDENPPMRVWIIPRARPGEHFVMVTCLHPGSDVDGAFERFTKHSRFAAWFQHAEKKKCLASVGNMYSWIEDPYKDQVLLVSDAVWCQEAEMTGALISGWKAANAVTLALTNGQLDRDGVSLYTDWWHDEVIEKYDHRDLLRNSVMAYCLTADDIHYLLGTIKRTLPGILDPYETPRQVGAALAEVMPSVQRDRPDVHQKLQRMKTDPLEVIFGPCIKAGFPTS